MHAVGFVLHPERDCSWAVGAICTGPHAAKIEVLGIDTEMQRIACTAEAVMAEELSRRADLLVSLGGDGTTLRAMRRRPSASYVLGGEPRQARLPGRSGRARSDQRAVRDR